MAVIQPSSSCRLYKNVEISSKERILPKNEAELNTYLSSRLVSDNVNLTMVKKTGEILLEVSGLDIAQCNYMSFLNVYDNKRWYALITDYDYVTNETISIRYVIDPFMTYLFDFNMTSCMISREPLSQTDYEKGEINPYDPDIYPFTTPEDLVYGPDLERPFYQIKKYADSDGRDGKYMLTSNIDSSDIDHIMGYKGMAIFFIAPIDFDEISDEAEQIWKTEINSIISDGGAHMGVGDTLMSGTGVETGSPLYSSFPRGYDIIAIANMGGSGIGHMKNILTHLTQWNSISQIVGIYAMSKQLFSKSYIRSNSLAPIWQDFLSDFYAIDSSFTRMKNGRQKVVSSKKLLNFPYSYIRVSNGVGDVKEFKYEKFSNIASGGSFAKFRIMCDLNSDPSLIMAPSYYGKVYLDANEEGLALGDVINVNMDEMITITQFPQIPFITDGYLTFLSNKVMHTTSQNTLDYQDQLAGAKLNSFSSFMGSLGGAASAGVGSAKSSAQYDFNVANSKNPVFNSGGFDAASTGIGLITGGTNAAANLYNGATSYNSAKAQLEEADIFLNGEAGEDIDWGRYNATKPAYANNAYHPGTQGGVYNYFKGVNNQDFVLTHVQLKDSVLDKYDRYFKLYGYNYAGMSEVPLFYQYIKGGSKQPHWELVDNQNVIYTQTMNASVTGIPRPYAEFIENTINNGVRFIRIGA